VRYADVRVIAAANINLDKAVREGKLRQDLYYRLNIIPLMLPTLKDRQGDIPLLAQHFLKKCAEKLDKTVTEFAPHAMQKLQLYNWPGNVRELESVVERAVLFSEQPVIRDVDIVSQNNKGTACQESFNEAKSKVITQFEIDYIQTLLRINKGNITKAAQVAQKNRRAFWQLIRKHQIDVQTFKTAQ
jgi:DNA-binding NtrC family response regulator